MATAVFTGTLNTTTQSFEGNIVGRGASSNISGTIPGEWMVGGSDASITSISMFNATDPPYTAGQVQLNISGTGNNFLPDVEDNLSITIESQGRSITFDLGDEDTDEPYRWLPSNSAEVITFVNAMSTSAPFDTFTLTLDYTPSTTTRAFSGRLDASFLDGATRVTYAWGSLSINGTIPGDWMVSGEDSSIASLAIYTGTFNSFGPGSVALNISGSQNNFIPDVENNITLTIESGGRSVTFDLGDEDTDEPYLWTPSNSDETLAFINAISTSDPYDTFTLTLDYTPSTPENSAVFSGTFNSRGLSWDGSMNVQDSWTSSDLSGEIPAEWLAGGVARDIHSFSVYFSGAGLFQSGDVTLNIDGGNDIDLIPDAEENLSIMVESHGATLTVVLGNDDTSEPYRWRPSNHAEVTTFANAISFNDPLTLTLNYGSTADTTAPTLSTQVTSTNGTQIILTFDEALDTSSVPAPSAFTVMVAGAERDVSTVALSGSTCTLTLASAITTGQAVTISYTQPS